MPQPASPHPDGLLYEVVPCLHAAVIREHRLGPVMRNGVLKRVRHDIIQLVHHLQRNLLVLRDLAAARHSVHAVNKHLHSQVVSTLDKAAPRQAV